MTDGRRMASCGTVTSPSDPIVQMTNAFNASSLLRYCNICTTALTPDENIIPKINITIMSFMRCPTAAITSSTTAAPSQAAPDAYRRADACQHHERHAEACTRADAQHVGAGQRIAEQCLHLQAADR